MSSNALDRTLASPKPREERPGPLTVINPDEPRPRLLIADDDPVVRATLAGSLSSVFDIVGTADDGDSAIELARRERPDAALIDVGMPAGGGLHATRGIREVSPGTAVVILSADESGETFVEFMKAGAMSYLCKGVAPNLIAERLRKSIALTQPLGQSLTRIEQLMSEALKATTPRSGSPDVGS
jgi:DNA-binding NarL/FixJ family response regulator